MNERLEILDLTLKPVNIGDTVVIGKDNGCSGCDFLIKGKVVDINYTTKQTKAKIHVLVNGQYTNAKDEFVCGCGPYRDEYIYYQVPRNHCNIIVIHDN